MRTLLGAGLVLLGGLLLLRALAAPVVSVDAPEPVMREIQELSRERQRAQIELERAEVEIQRELNEARARAEIELPPLPPMPELPAVPPLPPLPPMPPAPPAPLFQIGAWLNLPVVLLALLALLIWRRGRRDRASQQV
jgi:hypothetical protein